MGRRDHWDTWDDWNEREERDDFGALGSRRFSPADTLHGSVRRVARAPAKKGEKRYPWSNLSKRTKIILVVVLVAVLLTTVSGAIDGFVRFQNLSGLAHDGIHNLKAAESLVSGKKATTALFDQPTRDALTADLKKAEVDFAQLSAALNSPAGTLWFANGFPPTHGLIQSAAVLASAADEACLAGLDLVKVGPIVSTWLANGIFADPTKKDAGLSADQWQQIATQANSAIAHAQRAIAYASQADLSVIPGSLISASQRAQLQQLLKNPAQVQSQIKDAQTWLQVLPTLLGIKSPMQMLLLLQDRSELRATGGFMGNYTQLTVQNGQLEPFSLHDTKVLDANSAPSPLPQPQASYASWYPFANFGLRDSNLSPDFPTTAKSAIGIYKFESGNSVQGMIAITPVVIESILKVVGGVSLPDYGETATATNLEQLIHKHQLDLDLHTDNRKAFTAELAQALMQKVKAMPKPAFISMILDDAKLVQSKDVQVYFADPAAEGLLHKAGQDSSVTQGPEDGVTAVDENIGANKADQYVNVAYADQITVDAHGTATHNLTITYHYNIKDYTQLYANANYYNYLTHLRIYVPKTAKFVSANWQNVDGTQVTQFEAADLPNRLMAAGTVEIQSGVPFVVKLQWTVPSAVQNVGGHAQYQIDFQHQAGSSQSLNITVKMPGAAKPVTLYNGVLDTDKRFSVPA